MANKYFFQFYCKDVAIGLLKTMPFYHCPNAIMLEAMIYEGEYEIINTPEMPRLPRVGKRDRWVFVSNKRRIPWTKMVIRLTYSNSFGVDEFDGLKIWLMPQGRPESLDI